MWVQCNLPVCIACRRSSFVGLDAEISRAPILRNEPGSCALFPLRSHEFQLSVIIGLMRPTGKPFTSEVGRWKGVIS